MKNSIKNSLMALFSMAILIGCKKDEISVEKNESTQWEIDKSIVDNDIRTRLGYDPRFEFAYPAKTEIELPVLSFEGFAITNDNTYTVSLLLSKRAAQDVKVSLVYDTSVFEKVKSSYAGYELGEASLVQFSQAERTIVAGTTSATLEVKLANQTNSSKKLIVPFAIKVSGNDTAKTLDGKDYLLLKVFPKQISFEGTETSIIKNAALKNGVAEMTDKQVVIRVTASDPIPSSISIGLERDNSLATGKTIAPEGMEGTINKVNFQEGDNTVDITFDLQNLQSITQEGDYVLPFKLVAYDTQGNARSVFNNPILVTVKVSSLGIPAEGENEIEILNNYTGALIATDKYTFSSNYQSGHLWKLNDGRTNTGNWWIDINEGSVYLRADFGEPTVIRGIKITQLTNAKRIEACDISASNTDSNYILQGYVDEGDKSVLYLKFKEPIMARYLMLSNFENTSDQYIDIHEVEFF